MPTDLFALLRAQGSQLHTLSVERFLREGQQNRPVYDTAEDITGFYDDSERLIAGPTGEQILASGVFVFPMTYAYVPLQSRATLPAQFGGRTVKVMSSSVGDGAGLPTPDHQMIGLV